MENNQPTLNVFADALGLDTIQEAKKYYLSFINKQIDKTVFRSSENSIGKKEALSEISDFRYIYKLIEMLPGDEEEDYLH